MATTPQPEPAVDPFAAVHLFVSEIQVQMADFATDPPHDQLEQTLLVAGREFARRMLQARLDLRAQRERATPTAPSPLAADATARPLSRTLQTALGDVLVRRLGWRDHRHLTVIPADATLNLPPERYSLTVRRFVAEQVAAHSVETAQTFLRGQGIDVPKRQAEQLVVRMAQDFDAFYAWHQAAANDAAPCDPTTLLVMSSDAKGVRMVPDALRDATRKAAAADRDRPKGDPMARRKERLHDRRMAVVTAIWDQAPAVRTAAQIVDHLRPPAQRRLAPDVGRLPAPQHKRVWATVACDLGAAVTALFDEATRRDPDHRRRWVVLVDGADAQRDALLAEATRRGVRVTVVMDLLHAIHYLWQAGSALHRSDDAGAEQWVRTYLEKLLTRPIVDVVAGIRQSATLRRATAAQREAVENCATYLRDRARWMDYAAALAAGLPIATGVIEGACRHLVQDRLGITGARWDLPMAEAVLRLRALQASGHWEAYLRFHGQRESFRHHHLKALLKTA